MADRGGRQLVRAEMATSLWWPTRPGVGHRYSQSCEQLWPQWLSPGTKVPSRY